MLQIKIINDLWLILSGQKCRCNDINNIRLLYEISPQIKKNVTTYLTIPMLL